MSKPGYDIRELVEALRTAHCNVCGGAGVFRGAHRDVRTHFAAAAGREAAFYDFRGKLACDVCGASSRERFLVFVLQGVLDDARPLATWEPRPELRVLEPGASGGHSRFLERLFDHFPAVHDPEAARSSAASARRFADLESLHYPDDFFDVVLASEVFDRVRLHEAAVSEVYRVLKPGGTLVVQAPYVHAWPRTLVKVHPHGERDVRLYPAEGPSDAGYRVYGRDFLTLLRRAGFTVAYLELDLPRIAVSPQGIIVCSKGDFVDVSGFAALAARLARAGEPDTTGRDLAAVFHPDAEPIALQDPRDVRLLCVPDWDDPTWRRVVTSFVQTFGADDPVSLILRIEPPTVDQVCEAWRRVERLLEEIDVPMEAAPDIVLEASVLPPHRRGGIYTAATAYVSTGGPEDPIRIREARACGLPVFTSIFDALRHACDAVAELPTAVGH